MNNFKLKYILFNLSIPVIIFILDRVSKMPDNAGTNLDRNIRKMSKNANRDFDKIWVKYNNGNATYKEW